MSIRINSGDPLGGGVLVSFSDLHEMMLRRVRLDPNVFRLVLHVYSIALHLKGWNPLLRPIIIKEAIPQIRARGMVGQRELALFAEYVEVVFDFKTPALHHHWLLGCR